MENVEYLMVKYNGQTVGYLKQLENNRIAFQYDDEWIRIGFSISPFSLPLSKEVYISKYEPFNGLYGVFYDSLPDGWGELLINKMLVKKGINPIKITPLTKLALVNYNGLGGLNYEPKKELMSDDFNCSFDELYMLSKDILSDVYDADLDKMYMYGGSSGGTRPKAHITYNNESWIVKFPSKFDSNNVSKEEFLANELARECEINVPEFKLMKSSINDGYFACKRFDRIGNKRIHTISLSSLLETSYQIPNLDYLHLFQVVNAISINKENDLYEVYKRMCFNVFCFNKDDHGKNFSFIYDEDKKGYVLSPSYDLTILKNKVEHEMTVNGKGNPSERDLLDVAKIVKLSSKKCKEIIEKIKSVCSSL